MIGPITVTTFVVLKKRLNDQHSVYECDHIIFLHQNTQTAYLLKYFHLDTHSAFILCLTCSVVTVGQLLFGDASATAVLQFSQSCLVASQPLSFPSFQLIWVFLLNSLFSSPFPYRG